MAKLGRLIKKKKLFSLPEQEAYLSLWRAADLLGMLHDDFFATYGLTPHQYNALRILRGEYPSKLPVKEIRKRLIARCPDVTRLIDRLGRGGFVSRERPQSNRRTVLVAITKKGLDLLERLDDPLLEMHRRQLGHLTAAEKDLLIGLLERVREPHEKTRE
ncbi:MAG: MarR family transcriptional regulator [Planctomycetes bacterium]|nr:MarR family transcriptional regulator [Planctomycetota bacterium]